MINTAARLVRQHLVFCTSWCQTQWFCCFKGVTYVVLTLCRKLRSFLHWFLFTNAFNSLISDVVMVYVQHVLQERQSLVWQAEQRCMQTRLFAVLLMLIHRQVTDGQITSMALKQPVRCLYCKLTRSTSSHAMRPTISTDVSQRTTWNLTVSWYYICPGLTDAIVQYTNVTLYR